MGKAKRKLELVKKDQEVVREEREKALLQMKEREEGAPFIVLSNGEMEGILVSSTAKMLVDIRDNKLLPSRTKHFLSHLLKDMSDKVKPFIDQRDEIYQKYCDRNEDGEPVMAPDGRGNRRYIFNSGAIGMQEEINEIAEIKHEFPYKRLWFNKRLVETLSPQDMMIASAFADWEEPDFEEEE